MFYQVKDTGGVVFVPAFVGLYAPYWDSSSRGTILGLTRGTRKEHIIRAALEGIAWSTEELLLSLKKDMNNDVPIKRLKVDGGASNNSLLLQMQSNFSQLQIDRPKNIESTATGIHIALGLSLDFYDLKSDLQTLWKKDISFYPEMDITDRNSAYEKWKLAISKSRGWIG